MMSYFVQTEDYVNTAGVTTTGNWDGSTTTDGSCYINSYPWDTRYPWDTQPNIFWPQHYYNYTYPSEDGSKKAFQVAKKLVDKKLVKVDNVGDFITLMDILLGVL